MSRTLYYLIIGFFIFNSFEIKAQVDFDPSVIILTPNEVESDKSTEKEISEFNKKLSEQLANQPNRDNELKEQLKGQPENIQLMTKNTADFSKSIDFYSMIPSITEQFLQYRLFETFPNLLIMAKHEKSDGYPKSLTSIAEKYNSQFVINFKNVKTFKSKESKILELDIQIFDRISNSTILDRKYTGDESNPGFEFACENGTISCCANNAIKSFIYDAMRVIAENSPTLKRKNQVEKDRNSVLVNVYYPKPANNLILPKIKDADTTINKQSFYQGFMNDGDDKFIAFFAENSTGKDFKEFKDKYGDRNITMSEDYFSNPPNMYCFIVYGIKFQEKWYYKKDKIVHFKSTDFDQGKLEYFVNLKKWDFFKEDSDKFSDIFWETNLFAKVPDLTKDPDWDKYGESIWKTDEINNRPYIGLYEIVADGLKIEQSEKDKDFDKTIIETYVNPYITELASKGNYEQVTLNQMSKPHLLIYPKEKNIILCPYNIKGKKENKFINYIVLIKTESGFDLYKWNYLKPDDFKNKANGPSFMEQIKTLTDWNFSFKTLDNSEFWTKYVLLKEDDDFKYLEKK